MIGRLIYSKERGYFKHIAELQLLTGCGKQAWGNPSKYMYLKQEYRDEDTRQYEAQGLADNLSDYFAEVLRSAVGQIYVM